MHVVPAPASNAAAPTPRPVARGKFLFVGDRKLFVKGVTYGTFRPDGQGTDLPRPDVVEADFRQMAARGINAVRVYVTPPSWLFDLAQRYGLRVMVGLPWEQHVTFLDDGDRAARIERRVREAVRGCAGHPAILCYVIGNEIPASIVRWHGPRRIQRFLKRLSDAVRDEDPDGLVTYVNFPTTEYLALPFVDLYCFNVYLEAQDRLEAYLARLQNLADTRPLIMAEVGLDSRRHGLATQANTLGWQIRSTFAAGAAGLFVYAWTDEWCRGGVDIYDWDFGVTDRDRQAKPALDAVENAFAEVPFPRSLAWPRISVVVCSYNGSGTLSQTLEELGKLDYPDYEVIVVNDGSTDDTGAIARAFDVRLIEVPNGGLSAARNLGMNAARGTIVAYIDDDAYPDRDWLRYLAHTFLTTDFAAVGGPNLAPPGDGTIAECVANSPGGPIHVLLSDREAEHIPGCNMAYRRGWIEKLGGFDPRFRAAGDDVDVCWRLMANGGRIAFTPAAVVWHHRRDSIRKFWKQQVGYGQAEALLEHKWPEKYDARGRAAWAGRIYSDGMISAAGVRSRIYFGPWGLAAFQRVYPSHPDTWRSLTQSQEWFLGTAVLFLLSAGGLFWSPLLLAMPLALIATLAPVALVVAGVSRVAYPSHPRHPARRVLLRAITVWLHLAQPVARCWGRARDGLTSRHAPGLRELVRPSLRTVDVWSERWRSPSVWLEAVERALRLRGAVIRRGGQFDAWDLEIRGGRMGTARLLMAHEEHGGGRQLVRFRIRPKFSRLAASTVVVLAAACAGAALDGAVEAAIGCRVLALAGGFLLASDASAAIRRARSALQGLDVPEREDTWAADLDRLAPTAPGANDWR